MEVTLLLGWLLVLILWMALLKVVTPTGIIMDVLWRWWWWQEGQPNAQCSSEG